MFVVRQETRLPAQRAWARVVDWPAHARWVPLTRIHVPTPPPTAPGSVFVARTALGRFGFDDPMEIVTWEPPRFCRIEKRGPVMLGWAELRVEPRPGGSTVMWREDAVPVRLPARLHGGADWFGRRLFTRVLRGLLEP